MACSGSAVCSNRSGFTLFDCAAGAGLPAHCHARGNIDDEKVHRRNACRSWSDRVADLCGHGDKTKHHRVACRGLPTIGLAAASSLDDLAHDRELFENVFAKAPADMDQIDWWQFGRLMSSQARLCETLLLQVIEGALPEDAMDRLGCNGWRTILDDPKTACVWPSMRRWVSTAFREFVEEGRDSELIDCSGYAVPQTPWGPS